MKLDRDVAAKHKALVVLGMHRSGTSALAGCCAMLGADVPGDLMPATEWNEKGYFESVTIRDLNDGLLERLGSDWDDFAPLSADAIAAAAADEAVLGPIREAVEAAFGASRLFVLKDPRICRLLPVWEAALTGLDIDPRILIVFRHPYEVARSLTARDRLSTGHGVLAWLRHVLDAEVASRHLRRVVVEYPALLADLPAGAGRLAHRLGFRWPRPPAQAAAEIAEFLSRDLRHFTADHDDPATQSQWVLAAYEAMRALRDDPGDPEATARLDEVRTVFDSWAQIFSGVRDEARAHAERADAAAADRHQLNLKLADAEERAAAAAAALDRSRKVVRQAIARIRSDLDDLHGALDLPAPAATAETTAPLSRAPVGPAAKDSADFGFLRVGDAPAADDATIVVTGLLGSGTSMIQQVLKALGVVAAEDVESALAAASGTAAGDAEVDRYIAAANAAQPLWCIRLPAGGHDLEALCRSLRNPRVIVTFRDIVANALNAAGAERDKGLAALPSLTRNYRELADTIARLSVPTLLVSYETAILYPLDSVQEIAAFCGVTANEERIGQASLAIENGMPQYIRAIRLEYDGFLDGLSDGQLHGWAKLRHWDDIRVEVDLEVDGRVVQTRQADLFRPDLRDAGYGDGHYGFAFDIGEDVLPDSIVTVRVRNVLSPVNNSGRRLQEYAR